MQGNLAGNLAGHVRGSLKNILVTTQAGCSLIIFLFPSFGRCENYIRLLGWGQLIRFWQKNVASTATQPETPSLIVGAPSSPLHRA